MNPMAEAKDSVEIAGNLREVKRPAARLTISHSDEGDYTSRIIHLSLDGKKISSLKSGKSVTLEIKPGEHTLQADNTFKKKKESFTAGAGEDVRFVTRNRSGFGSSMIGIFGSGPLYLVLERENLALTETQS
jgi:hypothetical protein